MKFISTGIVLGLVLIGAESVLAAPNPSASSKGRCRGRGCIAFRNRGKVMTTTIAGGVIVTTTLPVPDASGITSNISSGDIPIATDAGDATDSADADVPIETGVSSAVSTATEAASSSNGTGTSSEASTATGSVNATANTDSNSNGGGNNGDLTLNPANVQPNSDKTGQEQNDDPTQANSLTDPANFINFCTGKTLTNGLQVKAGSCNGIVMGDIPSTSNMVSSIITFPGPGQDLDALTSFDIKVTVLNLVAGSFTNAASTYYSAPQALKGGKIVGHTHVTVQQLDSLNPTTPPDPTVFEFFKGINDAGDGNGNLKATVSDGLPAGFYRVCTMSSASNHQPVLMPVAQRGAQDDCQKFSVGQGGNVQSNSTSASSTSESASSSSASASKSAESPSSSATNGFGATPATNQTSSSSSNQNSNQSSNQGLNSTSTVTKVN